MFTKLVPMMIVILLAAGHSHAAPPSLRLTRRALSKQFRNLVMQQSRTSSVSRAHKLKRLIDQNAKMERLVLTSKRYGSCLELAPTNRKSLLETLQLSARQLGQQRVTGGRRQLSQIYRGMVRIGLESIDHHVANAARELRSPRNLERAIGELNASNEILSAIRPELLKSTERNAFLDARLKLQPLLRVVEAASSLTTM